MKGSKIYSIFKGKCPVCHSGNMYKVKNPYVLSQTLKMYEHCPHCNTKFKIEPSFFYGAMYVSYGVGIAIAVAAAFFAFFVFDLGRLQSFLMITATLILLLPVILRLSRNIWINFFFKFDPSKAG
jgi:uncharacterized protein (DUF983 family)